jgi:cytochrome c1
MSRGIQGSLLALALVFAAAAGASEDASLEDRVERLSRITPSTSDIMFQVGHRYQDLYWAAKLGKWSFAEYQLEELEALLETLQVAVPKRAATTQVFLDQGLEGFETAFKNQDWQAFQGAFKTLREQCMACHVANDHDFIVLPIEPVTAHSVILNLPR